MNRTFDVISIGGATQDVFVRSEGTEVIRISDKRKEKAWIGFDYGAKIPVDDIRFTVGGGATNTAVSFANLGLKAACMAKIGHDSAGDTVLKRLKTAGIDTRWIVRCGEQTGYSVILTSYEGERSILAFRGANTQFCLEDIDTEAVAQSPWIYVSSLSGQADTLLEPLFEQAIQAQTQISFNPGGTQLKSEPSRLAHLLSHVDLLFVNKEEAAKITGLLLEKPPEEHLRNPAQAHPVRPAYMYDLDAHLQALKAMTRGTVVITDGGRGTQAYDGEQVFIMPVYPTQVADVLGAGDAFGSAFTAARIKGHDVSTALQWGSANASGVVTDPGAHHGLMDAEMIAACIQRFGETVPLHYSL